VHLELESILENKKAGKAFDCAAFLADAGLGRKIVRLEPKDTFFSQGDPPTPSSICRGPRKTHRRFADGKEATITLLSEGDFVGEESLASIPGLRLSTASAVNACVA
jgi:CRP/FNR family cyclic AMP-dependent transcriptional regulator